MFSVRISFLRTEGFRLSVIYAAAFALSVLAMGAVVVVIVDQGFRDQILQSSRADIAAIRHGYANKGMGEAQEVVEQLMAAPGASDFLLLQRNGQALAGNLPPMPGQAGAVSLKRPGYEILGEGAYLAPGLYVFSGSDLSRIQAARKHLIQVMLWLLAAALVLAALGGALVSRSFLRRTDAMASACRVIMEGDMRARIPVRGSGDELDRLAGAINAMLDRISALMENLRQVTSDIAHDLRTPVTHLRSRLERADSDDATAAEHRQALQAAIAKTDDILAQFAALLRIAQIEGGERGAGFAAVELAPLLLQMRELFGAVAEEAGHYLDAVIRQDATIRGDRELLVQLFSNLIENAILHTPAGCRITLSLDVQDGRAIASVRDDGPGVPREEHEKLFRRLYRREASRIRPGYGLGLSLVAAIVELHGAKVEIVELPMPGLCVKLTFPA
ncbi:MAG TPA: HAMP domain-containing sensor histidine kinase [Rhizomicrobium sp.]|nr:HAMP domain-containing sensor histidine kinase [Rhizomicrobium sp.]